jgi:hypothetical protein
LLIRGENPHLASPYQGRNKARINKTKERKNNENISPLLGGDRGG